MKQLNNIIASNEDNNVKLLSYRKYDVEHMPTGLSGLSTERVPYKMRIGPRESKSRIKEIHEPVIDKVLGQLSFGLMFEYVGGYVTLPVALVPVTISLYLMLLICNEGYGDAHAVVSVYR